MSQNIFHIDPIFFLPIDFEESSQICSKENQNDEENNNQVEKNKKIT